MFRGIRVTPPEAANELDNLITLCRPHHAKWEGIPVAPEVIRNE